MVTTLSMMLFQSELVNSDQFHLLVIFVGVIALFCFVLLCILAGAAIGAWKAYKSVSAEIELVKQKAFPIVASVQGVVDDLRPKINAITAKVQEIVEASTPKVNAITTKVQEIVEDSTPKVKTITANFVDISDVAKNKVHEFEATIDKANQTVRDANDKTRAQVDKVNGMVDSTLKATSDLGTTIHKGIRTPVLEVAGVVNGVKAAIDVLLGKIEGAPKGGTKGSGRWGSPVKPGPVPVPAAGFAAEMEGADPSSAVPPSPGAAEVVERFRREQSSKL